MEKVLLLKNKNGAFPNEQTQVRITDFTYNAKRMGGAPTITATVMYFVCLDDKWSDDVYAEFNGEKYYLKQTPTSSKENTDARYKHEIELVSERIILDNVYFFNVVDPTADFDKPVNNNKVFAFHGTIHEFASRLKASLAFSNINYDVVVDEGIDSESKMMSFQNAFFSNAIQESYNIFNIPYYFKGKEIHFGYTDNVPEEIFEYGFNDALLSITKTNKNQKLVNRITGVGSSDNIPYYYPNPTQYGTIDIKPLSTNKVIGVNNGSPRFKVINNDYTKLSELVGLKDKVTFSVFKVITDEVTVTKYYQAHDANWYLEENLPYERENIHNIHFTEDVGGYIIEGGVNVLLEVKATELGIVKLKCTKPAQTWVTGPNMSSIHVKIVQDSKIYKEYTHAGTRDDFTVECGVVNIDETIQVFIDFSVHGFISNNFSDYHFFDLHVTPLKDEYEAHYWSISDKKIISLQDLGIVLEQADDITTNEEKYTGEGFEIEQLKYVIPQPNLLPFVYRQSDGREFFRNAINYPFVKPNDYVAKTEIGEFDGGDGYIYNEAYKNADGTYVHFNNPYIVGKPKEHTNDFEDIKPTISGMEYDNNHIDQFAEFAYDEDDNDEIDENGNYKHPYFFAKLHKLPFNLFEHSIESAEMSISMTSGACGGCEWVIGVGESNQQNLVQTDGMGRLLRDKDGNVRCGREGMATEEPQAHQNNTNTNEVWIALKKEDKTFGVIMPNASSPYKPAIGDTFVILNIRLPQSYIESAEKKLERSLIQYMQENNDERFDFSVKFSRIYFAEHPEVLEKINENARISIRYADEKNHRVLYVSSFQYKMSSTEVLPDISVELSDELTVFQNAIQNAVSEVRNEMLYNLGNIDWLAVGQKYFLRKDSTSDTSNAKTNFKKEVTFGSDTPTTKKAGIQPTGDAVFKNVSGQKATFDKFTSKNGVVIIDGNTDTSGDANVSGSIDITKNAIIGGNAQISGDAEIGGLAKAKSVEIGKYVGGEFGTGAKVYVDDNNSSHLIVDFATIRKKATFNEISVKELKHVGGTIILSAASMVIESVEDTDSAYICYFKTQDGEGNEIHNEWEVDDLARCQTFNLDSGNRYYWRKVIGVGTDFIVLSKTECDPSTNNDEPKAGDNLALLGNTSDITRQSAIVLSAYGEDAPSRKVYNGINDFSLKDKEVYGEAFDKTTNKPLSVMYGDSYIGDRDETTFMRFTTEEGLQIKGKVETTIGGTNLLLNTAFLGDYEDMHIEDGLNLDRDSVVYSPALTYWSHENVEVVDDNYCKSGKVAKLTNGWLEQKVINPPKSTDYVLSFNAKGTGELIVVINMPTGEQQHRVSLDATWAQQTIHIKAISSAYILVTFYTPTDATIGDIQLERGYNVTDWKPSEEDPDKAYANFKALGYLQDAVRNGKTDIIGGLILSKMLVLGNYKDNQIAKTTAGISGVYNDDTDVAFWAGGDLAGAMALVQKVRENPTYSPTEDEWANLAKVAITHGGDTILKGTIFADNGYFRGRLEAKEGYFNGEVSIANGKIQMNTDGSGHLANGNIEWNTDGDTEVRGTIKADNFYHKVQWINYTPNNKEVTNADIVIVGDGNWGADGTTTAENTIHLPNPVEYEGKVITIYSLTTSAKTIYIDSLNGTVSGNSGVFSIANYNSLSLIAESTIPNWRVLVATSKGTSSGGSSGDNVVVPNTYVLPIASATTLGGIKVNSGTVDETDLLMISNDGVLNVDTDKFVNAIDNILRGYGLIE